VSTTMQVAPHDTAAEIAVLTGVLSNNANMGAVVDIVLESHFYTPGHRAIWRAMRRMMADGVAIDYVTLRKALLQYGDLDQAGGQKMLDTLMNTMPVSGNIREHAQIIRDCASRRDVIRSCESIASSAYLREKSAQELIDEAQAAILSMMQSDSAPRQLTTSEHIDGLISWLQSPESSLTITTGLDALDAELTGGLRAGEVVIVAGRPSEGKSVLAMQIAINAAKCGKHVAVASLEMEPRELFLRSACADAETEVGKVRSRQLDNPSWERFCTATIALAKLPIVVSSNHHTLEAVSALAHSLAIQGKLDVLVIDYLQLLRAEQKTESRRHEVEHITRAIKLLAMRLKIPIVLLSQLSRAIESRDTGLPELSDLRESGAIEQDADIVIMVHHPDPKSDKLGVQPPGFAQLWIRKNRNGARDISVPCVFKGCYAKFVSLTPAQKHAVTPKKFEWKNHPGIQGGKRPTPPPANSDGFKPPL